MNDDNAKSKCYDCICKAIFYSRPMRVWFAKQAGNYGAGLCGSHSRVNRQNVDEKLKKPKN